MNRSLSQREGRKWFYSEKAFKENNTHVIFSSFSEVRGHLLIYYGYLGGGEQIKENQIEFVWLLIFYLKSHFIC
jgi:hypothetical protein